MVSDAEAAVSSLIAGVSKDFIFSVKRAGPQSHESNGAAERAVRIIKESFNCLLMEFEQHFGLALVFDPTTIQHALNYVSMAHNNFAVVHGSKRVPREISTDSRVHVDAFALFGSLVLGEVMDSLRQQNPQLLRFIPGAFLHPQFQSTVIIAKVRMGQELTMRKFVARSIKLCVPIRVCNDYGLFSTLVNERTGRPAVPSLPSEDPVNPHFHIRSILGPHWHWTLIHNGFRSLILCGSTLLESNRGLFSQKFSFTGGMNHLRTLGTLDPFFHLFMNPPTIPIATPV